MNDALTPEDDSDPQPSLLEPTPAAERKGAGAQLREARERLNLSLDDVAQQIKSAPRKLAALEAERWNELPERPYLRGLIRNYARVLQIDPEPLLVAVDAAKGTQTPSSDFSLQPTLHAPFPHRPAGPHESPVSKLMMLGVLVCAVVIGAIVLPGTAPFHEVMLSLQARLHRASSEPVLADSAPASDGAPAGMSEQINNAVSSPGQAAVDTSSNGAPASSLTTSGGPAALPAASPLPTSASSTAPATATVAGGATSVSKPALSSASSPEPGALLLASADQNAAASQATALHLQFQDDSWVEVRQSDGKVVSSQIFRSGTEQAIDASAPLEVVIGNAPAVKASYRGKPIDLDPYTHARVAHISIP